MWLPKIPATGIGWEAAQISKHLSGSCTWNAHVWKRTTPSASMPPSDCVHLTVASVCSA